MCRRQPDTGPDLGFVAGSSILPQIVTKLGYRPFSLWSIQPRTPKLIQIVTKLGSPIGCLHGRASLVPMESDSC